MELDGFEEGRVCTVIPSITLYNALRKARVSPTQPAAAVQG